MQVPSDCPSVAVDASEALVTEDILERSFGDSLVAGVGEGAGIALAEQRPEVLGVLGAEGEGWALVSDGSGEVRPLVSQAESEAPYARCIGLVMERAQGQDKAQDPSRNLWTCPWAPTSWTHVGRRRW